MAGAVSHVSQLVLCRKRQKKLLKAAKGKAVLPSKGVDLPVNGVYPFSCLGVTSEAFGDALRGYVRANPDSSLQGEHLMRSSSSSTLCNKTVCLGVKHLYSTNQ